MSASHLGCQFHRAGRGPPGGKRTGYPREFRGFRATDSAALAAGADLCAPGYMCGAAMNVDHEVNLLVEEIHRLGSKNADGKLSVKFGVLFRDDKCANLFEALVGTLKAAKRRKIITYPGELLLQGVHDDVDIILLQD